MFSLTMVLDQLQFFLFPYSFPESFLTKVLQKYLTLQANAQFELHSLGLFLEAMLSARMFCTFSYLGKFAKKVLANVKYF